MRRIWLTVAVTCFLVTLGLAVAVCLHMKEVACPSPAPVRQRRYSFPVAEGVRYRDYEQLGVDRFSFKRCRVEKRRRGAITFGAFNVLAVDELVVNFPAKRETRARDAGKTAENFAETFLRSQGFVTGRFSGLRINGLTVNRCSSNRVERVFTAALAESGLGKNEGLLLRDCVVSVPDGCTARVEQARLVLKPEPALVYKQDGVERRADIW